MSRQLMRSRKDGKLECRVHQVLVSKCSWCHHPLCKKCYPKKCWLCQHAQDGK